MFICHTINNIIRTINDTNEVTDKKKDSCYNNPHHSYCGEETLKTHQACRRVIPLVNLNNLTQAVNDVINNDVHKDSDGAC